MADLIAYKSNVDLDTLQKLMGRCVKNMKEAKMNGLVQKFGYIKPGGNLR